MSEQGFAYFVERPRRLEELLCPHLLEAERAYRVVKTLRLSKIDFENFITDMVADRQFLEDNAYLCSREGTPIRCLKVYCRYLPVQILVVPDQAWVDIAAFV